MFVEEYAILKDNHYKILFYPSLLGVRLAHRGTCLNGALLACLCLAHLGKCLDGVLPARPCLAQLGKCLGVVLPARPCLAQIGKCLTAGKCV